MVVARRRRWWRWRRRGGGGGGGRRRRRWRRWRRRRRWRRWRRRWRWRWPAATARTRGRRSERWRSRVWGYRAPSPSPRSSVSAPFGLRESDTLSGVRVAQGSRRSLDEAHRAWEAFDLRHRDRALVGERVDERLRARVDERHAVGLAVLDLIVRARETNDQRIWIRHDGFVCDHEIAARGKARPGRGQLRPRVLDVVAAVDENDGVVREREARQPCR